MAIPDEVKQQASSAVEERQSLWSKGIDHAWEGASNVFADIGNTYRAVHMQHTGWISSGRYYHTDPSTEIAEKEAVEEEQESMITPPEIGLSPEDPEPEGPEEPH